MEITIICLNIIRPWMFQFMIIIVNIVLLILQLKISEQPFTYLPRPCAVHFSALFSLSLTPSLTSDLILAEGKEMVWAGLKWCGHRWEAQVVLEVQVFLSVLEPEGGIAQDSRIQYQQRTQFIHLTIHHQTLHHLHQQRENCALILEFKGDSLLVGTQWSCAWYCSG